MSRTLSTFQAALLGLLLLAGVALTAAFILGIGKFGSDIFHVRAGFASVQGVERTTKVRIRGIEAGEVVEVEPPISSSGQVLLRLGIKQKFRHLVRADATVQIVSVGMLGGKAVEIDPGSESSPLVEENALLASRKSTELTDVMERVQSSLDQAVKGDGSLGKFIRDPKLHDSVVETVDSLKRAAQAIQADAEAMKKLPLVGKYVKDVPGLLDRATGEYNRKWFAEAKLFEPNSAVLTNQGRDELNNLGTWLESLLRHKGVELIVVAYGDPNANAKASLTLTENQSKAVLDYLNDRYNTRLVFFKSRTAHALGLGTEPPLPRQLDRRIPPGARVEILVFVPQT